MIKNIFSAISDFSSGLKFRAAAWKKTQETVFSTASSLNSQVYVDTENPIRRFDFSAARGRIQNPDSVNTLSGEYIDPVTGVSRREAQAHAEYLYRRTACGRNVVNQRVNHTVGGDFSVRSEDVNQDIRLTELWKNAALNEKILKLIRNVEKFGEAFIYRLNSGKLRVVSPFSVYTPPGLAGVKTIKDGIVYSDPNDPSSEIGFYIEEKFVPSSRVFHLRSLNTEDGMFRGWPELFDNTDIIVGIEEFLRARKLLNIARSSVVLVRKHTNRTGKDIRNLIDNAKSGDLTDSRGRSKPYFNYEGPKAVDLDSNTELSFITPNTGAQEAAEDGRQLMLQGAIAFQMPEYMFSGDLAGSSYATAAVAEAPGVKAMKTLQGYYAEELVRFFSWLDSSLTRITLSFPILVSRSEIDQVKTYEIEYNNGVMSKDTWMELRGRDPRTERAKIAADGMIA